MIAFRLLRTGFDTLENHIDSAIMTKELGTFVDDANRSAHMKIEELLRALAREEIQPYLGWDGEVYPKFSVQKVEIR